MSTQQPLQRPLTGLTSRIGLIALLSGTPALAEITIEGMATAIIDQATRAAAIEARAHTAITADRIAAVASRRRFASMDDSER